MLYWRAAQRQDAQHAAISAAHTRAAVAAAIVNTIAGKETPAFEEMIERLSGEGKQEEQAPSMEIPLGFGAPSSGKLEDFTES
jgi:hypothetical protein